MIKTITFAIVHFLVAFSVGYLITGSVLVGGAIALIEPACNTVAYYCHEKIWLHYENKRNEKKSLHISEDNSAGHSTLATIALNCVNHEKK